VRKVARFALSTIRGIGDPDDYILPEPGPQPPPFKGNVNVSVPADKCPELANQLLEKMGMEPTQEGTAAAQANIMEHASRAADAASNLLSPAHEPETPVGQAEAEKSA